MELSDGINIEAYSMMNAQAATMQSIGTAVLEKTMDLQKIQGAQLTQMMEQSVNPNLGGNIDIRI